MRNATQSEVKIQNAAQGNEKYYIRARKKNIVRESSDINAM
jgi:hypothetical protein